MAGRILNRRELRKQADQAEQAGAMASAPATGSDPLPSKAKGKAAASPRARTPRKAKAPPRLRARWGVFDAGMKQVAVFDYTERAAAEAKVADLVARKKSIHFLQMVKEVIPEVEPAPETAPAVG